MAAAALPELHGVQDAAHYILIEVQAAHHVGLKLGEGAVKPVQIPC